MCSSRIKFCCSVCNKLYFYYRGVHSHIKMFHLECTTYECDHCNYRTRYKPDLRKHVQCSHYTNYEDFKPCPHCGKRLKHLATHLRKKICLNKNRTSSYDCKKCKKNFIRKEQCDNHARRCGNEFYCDLCQMKFHAKCEIQLHLLRRHNNVT